MTDREAMRDIAALRLAAGTALQGRMHRRGTVILLLMIVCSVLLGLLALVQSNTGTVTFTLRQARADLREAGQDRDAAAELGDTTHRVHQSNEPFIVVHEWHHDPHDEVLLATVVVHRPAGEDPTTVWLASPKAMKGAREALIGGKHARAVPQRPHLFWIDKERGHANPLVTSCKQVRGWSDCYLQVSYAGIEANTLPSLRLATGEPQSLPGDGAPTDPVTMLAWAPLADEREASNRCAIVFCALRAAK